MEQQDIIERLSFVASKLRVSTTSFANRAGIGPSNYIKMLNGEQKITDKTLHRIANAFGVSFNWLLNGEGETPELQPLPAADVSNCQTGNGNVNEQNSTHLFEKALEEIAAQRQLAFDALSQQRQQTDDVISILRKALEQNEKLVNHICDK